MKTKQQLLKEASLLKQKLARVNKQINLTEVKRMQQLAGLITESQLNEDMYYVHDKEGMEEPIGPFTLDQAKQELSKQGTGWKLIDADTAKQIWSHLDDDSLNEDLEGDNTPKEQLKGMVQQLSPEKQILAFKLLNFAEILGVPTTDELILHSIEYSAEINDPDELLTIMADTMGTSDPDPFDGVFAYSDIESAVRGAKLPQDISDMITDDDRIRSLERG